MTQPDKLLVEQVFVAGNHLATSLLLIYDPCLIKTYDEALEKEGQPYADMWCAWRAIMDLALHNRSKHIEPHVHEYVEIEGDIKSCKRCFQVDNSANNTTVILPWLHEADMPGTLPADDTFPILKLNKDNLPKGPFWDAEGACYQAELCDIDPKDNGWRWAARNPKALAKGYMGQQLWPFVLPTKTPLPTIDYSESQSTVCPHCQGHWYGCSKNQRFCSEGK